METLADKYIIGLYQEMEDEVIADIARRVKKTGRYTETAELMAKSMVEQGYDASQIQASVMKYMNANKDYQMAVAENTKAYKQEIQKIIEETVKKAREQGKTLIANAGTMAWNNDLSMWEEHGANLSVPNAMSTLIKSFQIQTVGELKNLTRSMGFKNTLLGTTGIMDAYQKEMDRALLKIATGVFSFDVAVNDCIKRLAESGLRSIDYASGKSYQLDTAARMCVRTGMSQLSGRVTEMNLMQTGQDLVITSQHIGSRPEHVPWQNKVFSYSGKSKKYPDFVSSTGYGSVSGLKGPYCRHEFWPYWEGDAIPKDIKEPEPVKINGKEYTYYQATQVQRKMERDIRATKREIEAQHAIGGDVTQLRSKLSMQSNAYYDFSEHAGIRAKDNRLRVISGTSDLAKNNKYFNKAKENKGLLRIPQIPASNISKKIQSGEYSTKLKKQEYQKHVEGTAKYNEYLKAREDKNGNPQSILTISEAETQEIIEKKAGTGIIKVDRNGNERPQEQITCSKVIGKYYYSGTYINTKKAVIHYSKKGAHLVPVRGNNYD